MSQLKQENNKKVNISDLQNKYLKEIQELNLSLASFKKQTEEEIQAARKERDDAFRQKESAEKEISSWK